MLCIFLLLNYREDDRTKRCILGPSSVTFVTLFLALFYFKSFVMFGQLLIEIYCYYDFKLRCDKIIHYFLTLIALHIS